jgi:hypothetical protein
LLALSEANVPPLFLTEVRRVEKLRHFKRSEKSLLLGLRWPRHLQLHALLAKISAASLNILIIN